MFRFKNIDTFKPGIFERVGMLKGKRWYTDFSDSTHPKNGLFKPKRYEFKDKKVFCANHYGEFVGYLLAQNSHTASCPAELAILTKYYPHIHKERNGGTPEEKKGCIIYSLLEKKDVLEAGSLVIENYPELRRKCKSEDDIELFLTSVEFRTRKFYEDYYGKDRIFLPEKHFNFAQEELTEEYVENKVKENRIQAIEMIVYDCLYGNNDRHTDNWSMVQKYRDDRADIELYPLYDNERVLGLYENQNTINSLLVNGKIDKSHENVLFSRMSVPNNTKGNSNYKDVLEYIINNYPEETTRILERHLRTNTPEKVKNLLASCEGLPSCYINFGSQMYQDRYEFAKELLERNKNFKNKQLNICKIDFRTEQDIQDIHEDLIYFKRTLATPNKIGYAEEPSK